MANYQQPPLQRLNKDAALRSILEGTATETGERFFTALVENLAKALNVHGAWVTEYIEETRRLRALAFWLDQQWIQDYEYDISGTPCEPVVENTCLIHIPDRVVELYPNDPDLPKAGAVSYMGFPLLDVDERVLGHLAVIDTRPMPEDPKALALFRIFAARAAAELQRLRAEAEIRQREEELKQLVNSAMDAIVQLDHDLKITRVNQAAEKVFECSKDEILGQFFKRFLGDRDVEKLNKLIKELNDLPKARRYL